MVWEVTWYAALALLSTVISLAVVSYAWRQRSRPIAPVFFALMGAITLWSFVTTVQAITVDRELQILLLKLTLTVAATVPVIWIAFTIKYARRAEWFTNRVVGLLALEPAAFVFALWTNSSHNLVFRGYEYAGGSQGPIVPTDGPLMYAHLTYGYLLILLGMVILLWVFYSTSRLYRRQAGLLFVGALFPTAANVAFNLGLSPLPGVDFTATTFTITGVVFAIALFHYDVLDLTPVAYRNVTDVLGDGVLILDRNGELVEYNDHASAILDETLRVGDEVDELPPVDQLATVDGAVLTTTTQGMDRHYQATHSIIRDRADEPVGHLVILREITELKEQEQRLTVTNRILRHNLRNELNVVLGQTESLGRSLSNGSEELERIERATERLLDVSEEARYIQMSMELDDSSRLPQDVVPVVESVVDTYEERYPDATLTLDAPDSALVLAHDRKSLETVVSNLVENALEHNNRDDPTVTVEIRTDEETVTLHIADNGPGIPAEERAVIEEEEESPLQHGSGLGLWLVNWLVSGMGGTVTFGENDPRGTVVEIQLHRAESQTDEHAAEAS